MNMRERLDELSAPVMAWLIEHGYCIDMGGFLYLTPSGRAHIREAVMVASRTLRGQVEVPVPPMRQKIERVRA